MGTIKKIAKVAIPVALAAMPLLTLAVIPTATNPVGGNAMSLAEIQTLIERIATFLMVVAVVIAVIFIIWGAVVYMSAGGDDERAKKGKGYIYNGIIGAAVVFAVGIILQTVAGLVTRTFFG